MGEKKEKSSTNGAFVIKLGKFAIVLGGDPGEKNYSLKIQFHWDYKKPETED